jgi:hypothetical protein
MINKLGNFLSTRKPQFFFLLTIFCFAISWTFNLIQTLTTQNFIIIPSDLQPHVIDFFEDIRYLLRLIAITSLSYGIAIKLLIKVNLNPINNIDKLERELDIKEFKGEDIEDQLLIKYYQQSLEQSNVSFWFSLGMGTLGFLIIVSSIFNPLNQERDLTKIHILSGIIIEAVSALIFVQSNKTTETMVNFAEKIRLDRWMRKGFILTDTIENEDLKSKVKAIITMNLLGIKISDSDKEVITKITDYDKSIGSTYNPEDKKNI